MNFILLSIIGLLDSKVTREAMIRIASRIPAFGHLAVQAVPILRPKDSSPRPEELQRFCCDNYGTGLGGSLTFSALSSALRRSLRSVSAMVAFTHLLAVAGPVFVIASLAMPAGIGGGMLYVPLLIVTRVADPRVAAVLAQPIIVGAALAG